MAWNTISIANNNKSPFNPLLHDIFVPLSKKLFCTEWCEKYTRVAKYIVSELFFSPSKILSHSQKNL